MAFSLEISWFFKWVGRACEWLAGCYIEQRSKELHVDRRRKRTWLEVWAMAETCSLGRRHRALEGRANQLNASEGAGDS